MKENKGWAILESKIAKIISFSTDRIADKDEKYKVFITCLGWFIQLIQEEINKAVLERDVEIIKEIEKMQLTNYVKKDITDLIKKLDICQKKNIKSS